MAFLVRRGVVLVGLPKQHLARCLSVSRPLAQTASSTEYNVDPNDPQIAPTIVPEKSWKNEFYKNRGFTVVGADWKEWSDLPAPYKYFGVKVNPKHVETHGMAWSALSDWKVGVPAGIVVTAPLFVSGVFPGVDERMILYPLQALVSIIILKNLGPVVRNGMQALATRRAKWLLDSEAELNATIADTVKAAEALRAMPQATRMLGAGTVALNAAEAAALSTRVAGAQRDALVEQLNYLVAAANPINTDGDAAAKSAARAAVEAAFGDASVQQKSIAAAIAALKDGATADTTVKDMFEKAVAKARADAAAKPSAKPLLAPAFAAAFDKKFGLEAAVTADAIKKAAGDKVAAALLAGAVGGKTPEVGMKYTQLSPLAFLKK